MDNRRGSQARGLSEVKDIYEEVFDKVNRSHDRLLSQLDIMLGQCQSAYRKVFGTDYNEQAYGPHTADGVKFHEVMGLLKSTVSGISSLAAISKDDKKLKAVKADLFNAMKTFDSMLAKLMSEYPAKLAQAAKKIEAIEEVPLKNKENNSIYYSSMYELKEKMISAKQSHQFSESIVGNTGDTLALAEKTKENLKLLIESKSLDGDAYAEKRAKEILNELESFIKADESYKLLGSSKTLIRDAKKNADEVIDEALVVLKAGGKGQNLAKLLTFDDLQAKAEGWRGNGAAAKIVRLIKPEGGKLRFNEGVEDRIKKARQEVKENFPELQAEWQQFENSLRSELKRALRTIMNTDYLNDKLLDKKTKKMTGINSDDKGGFDTQGRNDRNQKLEAKLKKLENELEVMKNSKERSLTVLTKSSLLNPEVPSPTSLANDSDNRSRSSSSESIPKIYDTSPSQRAAFGGFFTTSKPGRVTAKDNKQVSPQRSSNVVTVLPPGGPDLIKKKTIPKL